jgi:adenine-specific DNA-methyltransferase
MNYIGSKNSLSSFILSTVQNVVGDGLSTKTFADIFAGTGSVGRTFKPLVKQVIANDVEYYSYILNRNYIGNHTSLKYQTFITKLNELDGVEGFIFQQYAEGGSEGRLYFSNENGKKIDAARRQIESWKVENKLSEELYFFLLASLLESADKVANTASVYGAYLKKTAQKKLVLAPAVFQETEKGHQVFQEDSNTLIKDISGDILYLDPPYNARQYGANYHLLTTIAKYDTFVPRGKTGLREYYKSAYCRKNEVLDSFTQLIADAQFKYIFLSYNNEGLMSQEDVEKVMTTHGSYQLETKKYRRFKADKTENRNHKADSTFEYLHILEKK